VLFGSTAKGVGKVVLIIVSIVSIVIVSIVNIVSIVVLKSTSEERADQGGA
jgi:hypothetical protein